MSTMTCSFQPSSRLKANLIGVILLVPHSQRLSLSRKDSTDSPGSEFRRKTGGEFHVRDIAQAFLQFRQNTRPIEIEQCL